MNLFKRFKRKNTAVTPLLVKPVVSGSIFRIEIIKERYYPQKLINNKWETIICTNELGWFIAPKGFTGYRGVDNAELCIQNAEKWQREAVEYYR